MLRAQGWLAMGGGSLPRIGERQPMGTQKVVIKEEAVADLCACVPHRYALNPYRVLCSNVGDSIYRRLLFVKWFSLVI